MGSLITGIGYIGARLAQHLLDSGEQVVGLDNLFSTDTQAVKRLAHHPRFTFLEGDIRDEDAVRRAFQTGVAIETVYHLAAQASANPEAAPARYTEETNLIGPRVVLDEAVRSGAGSFVFGGSLQVYGRRVEGVVDETRQYGAMADLSHLSKVHVEKLMEMYSAIHEIHCVSARIGLVYGLGPVMKTDPRFMTAPNKFCLQVAKGEAIRVDSGAYFPTGMIHVEDAARGLAALAKGEGPGRYEAVNLAGETASVAQVAGMVERMAAARGIEARVETPAEPPVAPEVRFPSALDQRGFRLARGLEEGVEEVLAWFANEGWKTHATPSDSRPMTDD